jgi:hypothetical protein
MPLDPRYFQALLEAQVAIDGGHDIGWPDTGLSMAQVAFAPHSVRLVVATPGATLARLSGRAEFIRRAVAAALRGLDDAPDLDENPPE